MNVYKVKMRKGFDQEARFMEDVPEVTTKTQVFANPLFKELENGQQFIATFVISTTGRRQLIKVEKIASSGEVAVVSSESVAPVAPVEKAKVLFHIPQDARLVFNVADKMAKRKPVTIMMVGPSGYGKTTIPEIFASATGRSFVRVNCSAIRDPEEWFGYREAEDATTKFVPTEFATALVGGNAVIVLDEVNRMEPWLHNTLMPILDHSHATTVHNEKFVVGPNVVFVMTMNRGFQFTGTFEMDQALLNRASFILEVGPLPREVETQMLVDREGVDITEATKIVETAASIRALQGLSTNVECSTRSTLAIARTVAHGLGVRQAFAFVIENSVATEDKRLVTDAINSRLAPLSLPKVRGDVFDDIKATK